MLRKFTLPFILAVFALVINKSASANLITVNGGSTPYTLANGDTLLIASGTYTGSIGGIASGATIIVSSLATFQPTSLPSNTTGSFYVYGTFTYTSSLTTNTNFTIHNYGMTNLGSVTLKGKDQLWTNHYGGTINFAGDVIMNGAVGDDNNVMINYETVNASGNFQMNSGSGFTNYKDFNVAGDFKANGGSLENRGNLVVTGNIIMNSGASQIINYCRMQASGDISISNGNFKNYSYLWAKSSSIILSGTGTIQNIQIPGATPPIVHGKNYTQTGGIMTGPALLYFYGTTSMTSGTIGVSGATTDTIKMNDITRTSPTTIFDVQSGGTRYPNVTYNAWGVPDSNRIYLTGCSVDIFLEIPLAINWKSFDIILSDDMPLLLWSAEFDRQTVFEIQRSYDGRNFSTINQVASIERKTDYRYGDRLVNMQSNVVYYRIKAVQTGGEVKYSQIRTVRFARPGTAVQTVPNPFTNNFIINYRAAGREAITVRILNVSGQQMFVKNLVVNEGNNDINITEAAQLAKGIYVVQASKGYNIISSSKIVKQ